MVCLWLLLAAATPRADVVRLVGGAGDAADTRANGRRLESAIANLRDGDVLEIEPGIFEIEPSLTLWVEQGYRYGGGIQVSNLSNVVIKAATPEERPVIFGRGVGDHMMIQACTNLVLDGLVFRGDRPEVVTNLFAAVFLNGPNNGIVFQNCQFEDFGNHGISHLIPPMESKGVIVNHCDFLRGGDLDVEYMQDSDGAAVSGVGKDWVVRDSRFQDCVRGVEVEGRVAEAHGILISSNHFERTSNISIMVFPTSGNMEDFAGIEIIGNTITNSVWVRDAPTYPDYYTTGILVGGGKNILVQSNTIVNTPGTGLFVTSSFCQLSDIFIRGNVISRNNGTGVIVNEWVGQPLSGVRIEGNEVALSGVRGVFASARGLSVISNRFDANTWLGDYSALRIEGSNSQGAVVHGNTFTNSTLAAYQLRGIRIGDGVPPVWLSGNVFDVSTFTPIDAASTSIRVDPIACVRFEQANPVLKFTTQGAQWMTIWATEDLLTWIPIGQVWSDAGGVRELIAPQSAAKSGFFKAEVMSFSR